MFGALGDRSQGRMASIKNKLRSTMTDKRLSALQHLSVVSDLLYKISSDDIIDIFSSAKSVGGEVSVINTCKYIMD